MRALVIPPQPTPSRRQHISTWPDIASLQQLVGGYVEIRYNIDQNWHLYCTERGQQSYMTLNLKVTELVRLIDQHSSPVYGTAVMVGTGPGGVDVDVPEELATHVLGI